nr:hypothetical protein [Proteus mirabilis]
MKKSLFSLLILSTLSLSTQAIAQQIHLGGYNIDIQGRVIDEKLTCVVQDPVEAGTRRGDSDISLNAVGIHVL